MIFEQIDLKINFWVFKSCTFLFDAFSKLLKNQMIESADTVMIN